MICSEKLSVGLIIFSIPRYIFLNCFAIQFQSCVPIMEDLSKAAMRTRHWKQLVRATGGAINVSSDGLTKMTLGRFMDLGLQNHADEVRGVIQRAAKEEGIEKALKTYEEVWLSKMFELVKHARLSTMSVNTGPTHEVRNVVLDGLNMGIQDLALF